jgi:hypothetical protein
MSPDPLEPVAEPKTVSDLRAAHESLRTMFQLSILCGIVLSASVFVLVYKQVASNQRQAFELQSIINEHQTNWAPKVEIARTNLAAFARENPSLAPILQKYFPSNSAPRRAAPPVSPP